MNGEFTLIGDVLKIDKFAISRYQHTAASFRYHAPRAFQGQARLMLACLDGEVEVEVRGQTEHLSPGQVLFANPEDLTAKRSQDSVSNLLVLFPRSQDDTPNYVSEDRADDRYLNVLSQASAAIFENKIQAEEPAFTRVAVGLEALIWALATHTPLRPVTRESTELERIYNDAVKHIALYAADSATTVDSVAKAIGASRSQFFRAFDETGETPLRYLRQARVRLAERLLQSDMPTEAAARASGFATVRRMRSALDAAQASGAQERARANLEARDDDTSGAQ